MDNARKTLTYWRTLEFLQQDEYRLPRNSKNSYRWYFDLSKDFPDGEGGFYNTIKEKLDSGDINKAARSWDEISVYVGIVKRKDCVNRLLKIINPKDFSIVEEDTDNLLLACYRLAPDGRYISGSLSVSTILWTIRELDSGSNVSLDSVIDTGYYRKQMLSEGDSFFGIGKTVPSYYRDSESVKIETDADGRPVFSDYSVTLKQLFDFNKYLREEYGNGVPVDDSFCAVKVRYVKKLDFSKNNDDMDSWLSFDFFSTDLAMVRKELTEDLPDLIDYILAPVNESRNILKSRFNVLPGHCDSEIKRFYKESMDLKKYPLGAWPSGFSPAIMQQIAINYSTNPKGMPIDIGKIFSVNGPPGTGKTTIVQEIVAANVVEKAILLSEYEDSDDAFIHEDLIKGQRFSKYWDNWHKLKNDRINDYSVLIATTNNKAAENITKGLPKGDKLNKNLKAKDNISPEEKGCMEEVKKLFTPEYSDTEELLYRNVEDGDKKEGLYKDIFFTEYARDLSKRNDDWGLVSVPLGRKKNISAFSYKVLNRIIIDLLRKPDQINERKNRYKAVREDFRKQYEKVLEIRNKLMSDSKSLLFAFDSVIENFSDNNEASVEAHISNPWLSSLDFKYEREKLFYQSLRLLKEFVLSSKSCWDNLRTLAVYWGSLKRGEDAPDGIVIEPKVIKALFETLFLMVPAISSTFASVGNMFKDVKQSGLIGTLIVDEAGQAEPHAAVGALFRSRKAIIVGDPKQLTPVVTDDTKLIKEKLFSDDYYRPYKEENISVQSCADFINPLGSYILRKSVKAAEGDTKVWVGSPLVVHRRCIDPMFTISNVLSYNGIMRNKTDPPNNEEQFLHKQSQWIDCGGEERSKVNHFVNNQGKFVLSLLDKAFTKSKNPDLFIISPFKTVISGMKEIINDSISDYKALQNGLEERENWLEENIGTVHKVQGKEAAEVIFLLGCSSNSLKAVRKR